MQAEHFYLESEQDGLRLGGLMMKAERTVGLVQLSHGMCEHKERYLPFMEYLAARGYSSVIHDHRGHGESVRAAIDLGYFYGNGAEALVEDLHQVTVWFKKQFPEKTPFYLFGHSMGSLAVRVYAQKYDGELNGLFVCGCPGENPGARAGLWLAGVLGRCMGERHRSRLITQMAFSVNNRRFAGNKSEHAWVCANEETVRAYDADPLCNFIFTLNGYGSLFRLMLRAYDVSAWKTSRPEMPVRFVSGADDPCMIDQAHFEGAMEKMRVAGYRQVSGRLYDGLRHEILNERCAQEIYGDIADQLDLWRAEKQ